MSFWTLTDHVCRHCLGRLLADSEHGDFGPKHHTCAQCGASCGAALHGLIPMCACAERVGGKQVMACERTPDNRPAGYPVVAARLKEADAATAPRAPRFVGGD